jgi:hypothetical protein
MDATFECILILYIGWRFDKGGLQVILKIKGAYNERFDNKENCLAKDRVDYLSVRFSRLGTLSNRQEGFHLLGNPLRSLSNVLYWFDFWFDDSRAGLLADASLDPEATVLGVYHVI